MQCIRNSVLSYCSGCSLSLLHGSVPRRITDEKLEAIQKESQEISALSAELFSLGENPEGADKLRKLTLETELEKKESGFYQVEFQIQSLKEKPGSIYDKYLVDEMDYNELWNDTDTDVTLWLIGSILLILFLSGIRTMDEKRGMTGLLRTTRAGREKLDHSRTLYAVLCTATVFLCMEFPLFLSYCRAGAFTLPVNCCPILHCAPSIRLCRSFCLLPLSSF